MKIQISLERQELIVEFLLFVSVIGIVAMLILSGGLD